MSDVAAVSAADVREWAHKKGHLPETQMRGRIPQSVTDLFNKAHKSKSFAGSPAKAEAVSE